MASNTARKITMASTQSGSPDHVNTYLYRIGETYEVGSQNAEPPPDDADDLFIAPLHPLTDRLADKFVQMGAANEGASSSGIRAKAPGPTETK